MEEEIDDIVGDVKYTDSQKSVATTNVYSMDFTDCSSDKNNSSGKDTYVIDLCDSEDSDAYHLHGDKSVINVEDVPTKKSDVDIQCEDGKKKNRAASTCLHNRSVLAHEIYTQTSKTIFEIAQSELHKENLETQTSFLSITENKTVEYRIEYKKSISHVENDYKTVAENKSTEALEDETSRFPASDSETIKSGDDISEINSDDRIIKFINDDSRENLLSDDNQEALYENTSDFEESTNDSDIEEDSLMEPRYQRPEKDNLSDISEVPQSVDNDVEELYSKLSENIDLHIDRPYEPNNTRITTLTPLTEESTIKRDSLMDITPESKNIVKSTSDLENAVLFTNDAGVKIKMFHTEASQETVKLPPIQNRSCPSSPHLNFLFSVPTANRLNKSGTLPCLYEDVGRLVDRWEMETKDLASGESPLISGRSAPPQGKDIIRLPPIHIESYVVNSKNCPNDSQFSNIVKIDPGDANGINIKENIKELKLSNKKSVKSRSRYNFVSSGSRSGSPSSESPDGPRLCEAAERGCEALCLETLKRLRSASWYEVMDTLVEIPKVLERFWAVISEPRIADLIRQVSCHVESPRTQVACAACTTMACILKNTNYTKKPDFYEAVTMLLMKTGSFSRPVRRAANVALDDIVCNVELSHAVTALCVHGVGHKSALVRCASGRLLVVCIALASGGRGLLRARPPSAAAARTHALRALSALLPDKNTDTRKYAERLYTMLRPLPNFEAYYLTDVDVETASKQMRKYDKLLFGSDKK